MMLSPATATAAGLSCSRSGSAAAIAGTITCRRSSGSAPGGSAVELRMIPLVLIGAPAGEPEIHCDRAGGDTGHQGRTNPVTGPVDWRQAAQWTAVRSGPGDCRQVAEPAAAPVTRPPQRASAASRSSGAIMLPWLSSSSQSSAGTRHMTSNSMPSGSLAYSDLETR